MGADADIEDMFLPFSYTLNGKEILGSVREGALDEHGGDLAPLLPEGATDIVVYRGEAAERRRRELAERMGLEPPSS